MTQRPPCQFKYEALYYVLNDKFNIALKIQQERKVRKKVRKRKIL